MPKEQGELFDELPIRTTYRTLRSLRATPGQTELVVILAGSGSHLTRGSERAAAAGDVLFFDEGEIRSRSGSIEVLIVEYDCSRLAIPSADTEAIAESSSRLSQAQLLRVRGIADSLEREAFMRRAGYQSLAVAHFLQLIGFLARSLSGSNSSGPLPLRGVFRAVGLLESNRARPVRAAELAKEARMSERTLLRAFRREVGTTPGSFHRRLRIDDACALLAESDLSVTEVAHRTGFDDSNYFSRQFRKTTGMSPRDFRRASAGFGA